jgi:hypothetical protein
MTKEFANDLTARGEGLEIAPGKDIEIIELDPRLDMTMIPMAGGFLCGDLFCGNACPNVVCGNAGCPNVACGNAACPNGICADATCANPNTSCPGSFPYVHCNCNCPQTCNGPCS